MHGLAVLHRCTVTRSVQHGGAVHRALEEHETMGRFSERIDVALTGDRHDGPGRPLLSAYLKTEETVGTEVISGHEKGTPIRAPLHIVHAAVPGRRERFHGAGRDVTHLHVET